MDCIHELVSTTSNQIKRCWKCKALFDATTLKMLLIDLPSYEKRERERKRNEQQRKKVCQPDYTDRCKASIDLRNYWK